MGPGWVSPALLCIPVPAAARQELPRWRFGVKTARPGSAPSCSSGPSPTGKSQIFHHKTLCKPPRGGTETCGVGRNRNKRGFRGSRLRKRLSPRERERLLPATPGRLAIPDGMRKTGKIRLNPDPAPSPTHGSVQFPQHSRMVDGWRGKTRKEKKPPRKHKPKHREEGGGNNFLPSAKGMCPRPRSRGVGGRKGEPSRGAPKLQRDARRDTNYFLADILARVYILGLRVPAGAQQYGWQGADSSGGLRAAPPRGARHGGDTGCEVPVGVGG